MIDFINTLLGFSVLDAFGTYFGYMVVLVFAVMAMEFFVQIFLTFWRWLLHDR